MTLFFSSAWKGGQGFVDIKVYETIPVNSFASFEEGGKEGRKERTRGFFFSRQQQQQQGQEQEHSYIYRKRGREDFGLDTGNSDDETHS